MKKIHTENLTFWEDFHQLIDGKCLFTLLRAPPQRSTSQMKIKIQLNIRKSNDGKDNLALCE